MSEAEKPGYGGVASGGASARERGEDFFRQALSPHPDDVESQPQRFGRGRPKGARNRSSSDLALMVQQIGGHPVLALARIAGMSIQDIREMLGCTRLDAFDRWVDVLEKLAPYVASKQPLAVAVSTKVTSLNFTVPLGDGQAMLGPDAVAALMMEGARRAALDGFDSPQLVTIEPESESDDETGT